MHTIETSSPGLRSRARLVSLSLACLLPLFVLLGSCKSDRWEPTDPPCELDPSDPQAEPVETRCDGLDNDCDLHVDLLLPVDANRCQTGKQGACAEGFATCVSGARECLAPPPTAETLDGIDNDCNGAIDDVPASRSVRCRILILLPDYLTLDSPEISKLVAQAAESVGLPFDLVQDAAGWTQAFSQLKAYSLIVIPGYVMSSAFSAGQVEALGDFVEQGGVLIWQKLIGTEGDEALMALAGVTAATKTMEATDIKMGGAPATLYFDSPEERNIKLVDDPTKTDEVFLYTLDPQAGASGLGLALAGDRSLGTAIVRRSHGAGAIYTMGHGLFSIQYMRCYVNCFDPGTDLFAMLLKGALRESCAGHTVNKHTVPGLQSSLLTISHDVDAPDSHNEGNWGAPGAIQMAEAEYALGVKGTNFVTTDYVAAYYNPDMVKEICALGMCPEGPHSVQHLYMDKMPKGDCGVTFDTYDVENPTVCGEIAVSIDLLREVMPPGSEMITWRTPYLENPPDLYEVLHSYGIHFDSSMALGDLRSSFPISLANYPHQQDFFRGLPMFEFLINLEDGIGGIEPDGKESRIEVQQANLPQFISMWSNALMHNAANGAWNVLLVHPSYGRGVGWENLTIKIKAVETMIQVAREHDLLVEPMTPLAEFWRGRDNVKLDASYTEAQGYTGTLVVGQIPAPRFSLSFGDHLVDFSCPGAGAVQRQGGRVVFENPLQPGKTYHFTARVK